MFLNKINNMATYKSQGIIIKRRNFGEADRILTIYTKRSGKISAIAKGVRKPLSKLGGHLELFYVTDFILSEGRNFDIVAGAELCEDFPKLRKNLHATEQAFYISELTDKLLHDEIESRKIYSLLYETLKNINNYGDMLFLRYFETMFLQELGHRPEVENCVKCQEVLIPEKIYWSSELGGVHCENCKPVSHNSIKIRPETVKIIRLFLAHDSGIVKNININNDLQKELDDVLEDFIKYISEKEIYSKKYTKR